MAVVEAVLVPEKSQDLGEVPFRKTLNFCLLAFILLNSAKDNLALSCVAWLMGDTQVEVLI